MRRVTMVAFLVYRLVYSSPKRLKDCPCPWRSLQCFVNFRSPEAGQGMKCWLNLLVPARSLLPAPPNTGFHGVIHCTSVWSCPLGSGNTVSRYCGRVSGVRSGIGGAVGEDIEGNPGHEDHCRPSPDPGLPPSTDMC